MKASAFDKRIKRRVIGREHTFFASCPPGLRNLCKKELHTLFQHNDTIELLQGGVKFNGRLEDLYLASLHLRSPSKILIRISNFKASSFSKLEKKINEIDWELYLPLICNLDFKVTAKKSRLYHSDAIAQRCKKIIWTKFSSTAIKKSSFSQSLHVRVTNDKFEISLDTSGEFLFKRGIKEKIGTAPLRENLAFFLLDSVKFAKNDILVDPMCGSGTFPIEASMIKANIPPGFYRNFAFENWPGFRVEKFDFLKSKIKEKIRYSPNPSIFASDLDPEATTMLEKNISNYEFGLMINIAQTDFFSIETEGFPKQKGVVLLNPPYGRRIGKKRFTSSFYKEIGKKLKTDFKGWRAGIILPSRSLAQTLGFNVQLKPFFHGGLDLVAAVGRI
jgi:putative N6-adenine-specific DNA methylase